MNLSKRYLWATNWYSHSIHVYTTVAITRPQKPRCRWWANRWRSISLKVGIVSQRMWSQIKENKEQKQSATHPSAGLLQTWRKHTSNLMALDIWSKLITHQWDILLWNSRNLCLSFIDLKKKWNKKWSIQYREWIQMQTRAVFSFFQQSASHDQGHYNI